MKVLSAIFNIAKKRPDVTYTVTFNIAESFAEVSGPDDTTATTKYPIDKRKCLTDLRPCQTHAIGLVHRHIQKSKQRAKATA